MRSGLRNIVQSVSNQLLDCQTGGGNSPHRPAQPELLQDDCIPEKIAGTALELLEPKRYELLQKDLQEVKEKLGAPGAVKRVAELVLRMARQNPEEHFLFGKVE